MKLSKSFCNRAVLRKNITRFAPVWGIYTICLIFGMLLMAEGGIDYDYWDNLCICIGVMGVVNLGYAFIVAQALFGDLYNTRMCNALHAMPLRRKTWYSTNVLTGILFSAVPTALIAIFSLLIAPMSCVRECWKIPLYWYLGSNLSYIVFFGISVLCVFVAGNRFAMTLCYAIVNFGSAMVYALAELIYTPMLFGVKTYDEAFMLFIPVYALNNTSYLDCRFERATETVGYGVFTVGSWSILLIYAALGVAFLGLGLLLYRRRKLECAGDFMAIRSLSPVFLVIFSISCGTVFYGICDLFTGVNNTAFCIIYLICGMIVGFFAALMLLNRTARVFTRRAFAGCGALILGFALSIVIVSIDPFGVETRMPEQDEIEAAVIFLWHRNHPENVDPEITWGGNYAVALDEKDISRVQRLHTIALEEEIERADYTYSGEPSGTIAYTISYRLKDGSTLNRYYYAYYDSEAGNILNKLFSSTECVLGCKEDDISSIADQISFLYCNNDGEVYPLNESQALSLVTALKEDCQMGNMAQNWSMHGKLNCNYAFCLELGMRTKTSSGEAFTASGMVSTVSDYAEYFDDGITYRSLDIFSCCENTIQWLKENLPELYEIIASEGLLKD